MSEKWVRETGLVFALLFLLLGYRWDPRFLALSALFIVILMFAPSWLNLLARSWFFIAETLGKVMNKVLFGLVYFLIITPISLMKRLSSGDTRNLARETTRASALVDAKGLVKKSDLSKPY